MLICLLCSNNAKKLSFTGLIKFSWDKALYRAAVVKGILPDVVTVGEAVLYAVDGFIVDAVFKGQSNLNDVKTAQDNFMLLTRMGFMIHTDDIGPNIISKAITEEAVFERPRLLNIREKDLFHITGDLEEFFAGIEKEDGDLSFFESQNAENGKSAPKVSSGADSSAITDKKDNAEVKQEYKGVYEGQGQLNEAFEYMRNAFQDANRLFIVGEPGVGKTVLLLKFANDLFDKIVKKLQNEPELRLDNIKDSIPVIFNLASWSEDYKIFKDWLIAMLKTGEGLSEAFADELLSNKKIFLLLDGLDELAKNETPEKATVIRAKCFYSIVDFLRGGQKAVICCRIDEYWQIRKDIGQEDEEQRRKMPEVFVKNLDLNQIGDALKRASNTEVDRESALNILKLLKTENRGVLLQVFSIPFYFTTALEVFDCSILKEKKVPANEQELKDYLVGKLIKEKL